MRDDDDLITVCAACLQASCWQGTFMCERSQNANILQKTRRELKALNLEHPDYWKTDEELIHKTPVQIKQKNEQSASKVQQG